MRHFIPIVLTILEIASTPAVQAQVSPDSGARVRITSPEIPRGRTVGVLERFTADTVVVAGRPVSRISISRFEVSTGRKSHWLVGMGIGLGGGAAIGALAGALACRDDARVFTPSSCAAVGGVLVGGAGLLVGGIVGAISHSDRWRTTSLTSLRIGPILRPNGTLDVSLGVRF